MCVLCFDKKHNPLLLFTYELICVANVKYSFVALFNKRDTIFAKSVVIGRNILHFDGKVQQSLDCGALQDSALSGIASKCGVHGGISATHGTPC